MGSKYKVCSPNYQIIKFLVEKYTRLQISILKITILHQWLRGVALWAGLEFESQLEPLLLMICEPDNQLSWWLGLRLCRQSNPYKKQKQKQKACAAILKEQRASLKSSVAILSQNWLWWRHLSIRKFVCLTHCDLPYHDTLHCAIGIVGKPSRNRGAPRWFCIV